MNKTAHILILIFSAVLVTAPLILSVDDVGVGLFGFKWPIHCMMHRIFNVKCAFCGMTRSFTFTSHGQLAKAFELHKLGPVLYTFLLMQVPYRLLAIYRSPRKIVRPVRLMHRNIFIAVLLAILVNWFFYLGGRF